MDRPIGSCLISISARFGKLHGGYRAPITSKDMYRIGFTRSRPCEDCSRQSILLLDRMVQLGSWNHRSTHRLLRRSDDRPDQLANSASLSDSNYHDRRWASQDQSDHYSVINFNDHLLLAFDIHLARTAMLRYWTCQDRDSTRRWSIRKVKHRNSKRQISLCIPCWSLLQVLSIWLEIALLKWRVSRLRMNERKGWQTSINDKTATLQSLR